MKSLIAGGIAAFAIAVASPVHAESVQDQFIRLMKRAPAEIEPLIEVKGDSLDPSVKVSSYGATKMVSKGLLSSSSTESNFLRAFIDRKTHVVTAQIYHIANYGGSGWRFFERASFESPAGLQEVSTDRIGSDVDCQRYGCYYTEDIGISVPFAVLEAGAVKYDPANPMSSFRYRIFAKSGDTIDDAIPVNEIAAFVNVVRRAQAEMPAK